LQMAERQRADLYREVGKYVARMHNITSTMFGRVSRTIRDEGHSSWSLYLKQEIAEWKATVLGLRIFSEAEISSVEAVLERFTGLLDEITASHLVHADLWEGNILVRQTSDSYAVAAIIDADRAIFGDPDFEFASPWMINSHFLEGYGPVPGTTNSTIRKRIYRLIYHLLDAYIWLVQYNNQENSDENKKAALQLVDELL
jgi:fructosamine-3-kinase